MPFVFIFVAILFILFVLYNVYAVYSDIKDLKRSLDNQDRYLTKVEDKLYVLLDHLGLEIVLNESAYKVVKTRMK